MHWAWRGRIHRNQLFVNCSGKHRDAFFCSCSKRCRFWQQDLFKKVESQTSRFIIKNPILSFQIWLVSLRQTQSRFQFYAAICLQIFITAVKWNECAEKMLKTAPITSRMQFFCALFHSSRFLATRWCKVQQTRMFRASISLHFKKNSVKWSILKL